MFYATHDADNGTIAERATIRSFSTREEAVAYLLEPFDSSDWDHGTAVIEAGRFGDCWQKRHFEVSESDFDIDVSIQAPGQHPGGRYWWVTPTDKILVVANITGTEA